MKTALFKSRGATTGLRADWEEMVFRGRNRAYGAYVLRKKYEGDTLKAFTIVLGLLVFVTILHVNLRGKVDDVIIICGPPEFKPDPELAKLADKLVPPIIKGDPAPKLKTKPEVPTYKTVKQEEEAPKPKEEPKQDAQQVYTAENGTGTGELPGDPHGDPNGLPDGTGTDPSSADKLPGMFEFFDGKLPEALNMKAFSKRVGYPPLAKEAGIQGKVLIRALVDTNGTVMQHVVIRNPHNVLTTEVEKHLGMLKFSPGVASNQRKVRVWVNLPVDFRLK
jgi:protein TonB